MAGELNITIIGRLVQDVELRYTPSGSAVANLTIAQNARVFDKNSNEWKDKPTNFFRCTIWREAAENAAEVLTKGSAVIAYGEVTSRSYEAKDGQQRTVQEIELSNIGLDLRWANKRPKTNAGFGNQQQPPPQDDPWATPSRDMTGASVGWGGGENEPPF